MSNDDFSKWILRVLTGILLTICGIVTLCSCSADSAAILEQNLATLDKHKVEYSLHLRGPTDVHAESYQGVQMGTGGWLDITVTSKGYTPPGVDQLRGEQRGTTNPPPR